MSDDLALAVGKIILVWGKLDQKLHTLIRASEAKLGEPPSLEGRFTERRKIFRRLCMRLSGGDDGFKRRFDKICTQLVKLERRRGRIAHGFGEKIDDRAFFLDVPGSLDKKIDKAALAEESCFTFPQLAELETEIAWVSDEMIRLNVEAYEFWTLRNQPAR
jgi:hypothetical protein